MLRLTERMHVRFLPALFFFEDFETIGANNGTLTLPDGKISGKPEAYPFKMLFSDQQNVAKQAPSGTGVSNMISWFITPPINLTERRLPNLHTWGCRFCAGCNQFPGIDIHQLQWR